MVYEFDFGTCFIHFAESAFPRKQEDNLKWVLSSRSREFRHWMDMGKDECFEQKQNQNQKART